MTPFEEMTALGYRYGAPTPQAAEIDGQVAAQQVCPRCGSPLHYEGYQHTDPRYEYIALTVCGHCGYSRSF
jgi:C4-type Zn-finger protein